MPGPQRTIQRRSSRPEDRQHDGRRKNEKWRQVHDALKRRMPCVRREYHVISAEQAPGLQAECAKRQKPKRPRLRAPGQAKAGLRWT